MWSSSSSSSRGWGVLVRWCVVVLAVASALYVSAPALTWKLKKGGIFGIGGFGSGPSSCEPCVCDCPPPLSLLNVAPGLLNLSVSDCGRDNPDLKTELEKPFTDLLTEELQLHVKVAEEHTHRANLTFIEARKLASQYQQEAEKCNAAIETCEQARERSEAALAKEKKVTAAWERRARQLGWQGD